VIENVGRWRRVAGALVGGTLLAMATRGASAAKSSPPVGGSKDCGWRVTRTYGPEALTYRLHLTLGGCSWWDGSARSLKVAITRADDAGGRTARSSPAACATPAGQSDGAKKAHCDASATLDHPEGETAHYSGEATWEWNDGLHRVAFDTTCTTTSESVSCDDDAAGPA